jgi:hypothetical protein
MLAMLVLGWAQVGSAQTADEVIEKVVAAIGGRAALSKLTSQSGTGTITLSTPGGDVSGTVEMVSALPNKSRSLIKVDLSSLGAGPMTLDQRFDGTSAYILDSLNGNRDITGGQLDNIRNGSFPNPYVNYKKLGATLRLIGKEKVGDRDAYALTFDFPSGPLVRHFIDAETYLPIRVIVKVDIPQLGREVEQTNDLLDYRQVGDIKVPFQIRSSSAVQDFTITLTKVEHNVKIDDALFTKPK